MNLCIYLWKKGLCIDKYIYIYIYIYIYLFTCIHTYMYTHKFIYPYIHLYWYIRTWNPTLATFEVSSSICITFFFPVFLVNLSWSFSLISCDLVRTGWRRLIGSPKLQIIFHTRATKYRSLLQKMTYKDKGSSLTWQYMGMSYIYIGFVTYNVTQPTKSLVWEVTEPHSHIYGSLFWFDPWMCVSLLLVVIMYISNMHTGLWYIYMGLFFHLSLLLVVFMYISNMHTGLLYIYMRLFFHLIAGCVCLFYLSYLCIFRTCIQVSYTYIWVSFFIWLLDVYVSFTCRICVYFEHAYGSLIHMISHEWLCGRVNESVEKTHVWFSFTYEWSSFKYDVAPVTLWAFALSEWLGRHRLNSKESFALLLIRYSTFVRSDLIVVGYTRVTSLSCEVLCCLFRFARRGNTLQRTTTHCNAL